MQHIGINTGIGSSSGSSWTAQLPQKLIVTPAVYTEEMDAVGTWVSYAGTRALNNTEFHSGTGSLKLTSASGVNAMMEKTVDWDLSAGNGFSLNLWVYPHSVPADTIGSITLMAAESDAFTDYFKNAISIVNLIQGEWQLLRRISASDSDYPAWTVGLGNPNWNNINRFRIVVNKIAGQISECSFDLLKAGEIKKPAVMISFDDGLTSTYEVAYPLMKARGLVGTCYVQGTNIVNHVADRMTASQLQELNANGWDVGNHTYDHAHLSTLTQAQAEAEFEDCRVVLDGLGLTRSSKHVAYPYSEANATVLAAMAAWGAKTGRGAGMFTSSAVYESGYPYTISQGDVSTLALIKLGLDRSIYQNAVCVSVFHDISAGVTSVEDFTAYLDYIVSLGVQTLTIDEYDRLNSGPITVHHK